MKVNSIGVDTYRQAMNRPSTENRPAAQNRTAVKTETKVQIPGHLDKIGSELSVKLKPGTFADMLSLEEKRALEILFARLGRVNDAACQKGGADHRPVGNFVDVTL
jgi:hypothetical protein